MNDPILVTGAAGFIGFSAALRLLQDEKHIVGIDNMNDYYDVSLKEARLEQLSNFKNFTFIKLDISHKEAMKGLWNTHGPFKNVVHLAAQAGVRHSLKNPYDYITSNCMGHLTVLEMCRHTENFEHLVYASSSSVYGANKKTPFSVKDETKQPVSLYAATKASDELMSYSYAHLYNLPQTGLRFFTVYGPWGRPDMSPIIFAKAISEGKKVPIFNNGDMKRDFTFIDDIVDGILKTLAVPPATNDQTPPCRILNLGNNRSENLMDYVGAIETAIGKKADIDFKEMQPGDVKDTYADISETTQITGYKPTTTIYEGIPKFIEWYKSYYG